MAAIENKPMFLAQITDTLFDVTIPDSSIANPAAMNMTRKPQIKNRRVLKIKPTSWIREVVYKFLQDRGNR